MKYLSYVAILFTFLSCDNDSSNVQFRIQNNLGEPITRAYLGARIFKSGNSYRTKSYKVKWSKIEDGEITSYKKVRGKFWGYSNLLLEFFGPNKKYPHQVTSRRMDEAVEKTGIELIKDTMKHPYTDKIVERERLPDGKYTMVIQGFHPKIGQSLVIKIVKD